MESSKDQELKRLIERNESARQKAKIKREQNKEQINNYYREYRQKNRAKIQVHQQRAYLKRKQSGKVDEYLNKCVLCPCGEMIKIGSKDKHSFSYKHIGYLINNKQ